MRGGPQRGERQSLLIIQELLARRGPKESTLRWTRTDWHCLVDLRSMMPPRIGPHSPSPDRRRQLVVLGPSRPDVVWPGVEPGRTDRRTRSAHRAVALSCSGGR